MCGILGYAGHVKPYRRRAFMELMDWLFVATQVRGRHAAGFYALRKGEVITHKLAIPSCQFIQKSAPWQSLKKDPPELLVAHCRWASHGDPTDPSGAHPFLSRDEQLGFVHNGVLRDHEMRILEELGDECDTPVDSERMLRFIERIGDVRQSVAWLFDIIDNGDYACVMGDAREHKIYAWRNEARPLCFLNLHEAYGTTVFFSTAEIFATAYRDAFERKANFRMLDRIRQFRSRTLYMFDDAGTLFKPDLPSTSNELATQKTVQPKQAPVTSTTVSLPAPVFHQLALPAPTVRMVSLPAPKQPMKVSKPSPQRDSLFEQVVAPMNEAPLPSTSHR